MSSNSSTAENRRRSNKTTAFPSTRRARPASPTRRVSPPPSTAALTEELSRFEALEISPESPNPRSFPHSVKQQCWEKAEKIKGRHPDRWRRDSLGNTLFRKLVGCPGCLCHDYDHIVPYSKGGKSTLENCQVLQETRLKCQKVSLFKRVLTAVCQAATWTFLSCRPMVMFVVAKIRAGVKFNNKLMQQP